MDKNSLFNNFVLFTTSVHQVTHEFTKDAKPKSISQIQYKILEYIAINQPVTPSDINDCLHMAMPNTSRELKKLREKNLIEKIDDTEDRRKQSIHLSKDGQAIIDTAFEKIKAHFLHRIQHSSKEEIEEIERAVNLLQTKLFYY